MTAFTTLWDWRRQVADLYAQVRAEPDAEAAWQHWRAVRDRLFRDHPQSPIEGAFTPLDLFPYDPALRFHVALDTGRVWPRHGPKRPGTVTIRIGDVIPAGLPRDEIEARVYAAINVLDV